MHQDAFSSNYNKLNNEQKQAVDSIYGPAMVVAGPGTGKTQIIGMRTANIILKTGVAGSNILISTFTDAGVVAIRERLVELIGNDAYGVHVCTIHSFAQDVIKTFPEKFIQYKAGTPLDGVDQLEVLKNILDTLVEKKQIIELTNEYDPYLYLRDIQSRISHLKWEGISKIEFDGSIEKQTEQYTQELSEIKPSLKKYETTRLKQEKHIAKLKELSVIFEAYNQHLRNLSLYDFNDMINFVLEKFWSDQELVSHYAEQYQFIMLDEYQDTNNAQNKIIEHILSSSEEQKNIMVVGDDDQSIYRFQWANIENMLDFSITYPDTQYIVLTQNYRSSQNILDASEKLIHNNSERLSNKIDHIEKHLHSAWVHKETDIPVQLLQASSDIEEQSSIIQNIRELWKTIPHNKIAIIVRNNREVKEWSNILLHAHIPSESKLQADILQSDYIQFILQYAQLIIDPYFDETALIHIMRSSIFWLNQVDIMRINRALYIKNYARKFNITIMDFLSDTEALSELNLEAPEKIIAFRDTLLQIGSETSHTTPIHFFDILMQQSGILTYIGTHGSFDDIQDVFTLLNIIKKWNEKNKHLNLPDIFSKLKLYESYNYPLQRQIIAQQNSGVQIMTAHGSKWLEYEAVFIPGLYTGNWESKRMVNRLKLPAHLAGSWIQQEGEQIQEDRRLFFVAITRAKKYLYLSYPAWIGNKPLLQSRFIEEISETLQISEQIIDSQQIQSTLIESLQTPLIEYSQNELDYIEEFLETYKLSASDLNVFLEDPLQFLERVVFKYPFKDNRFTIFGKVYHRTLELFYLKQKNEGNLPESSYLTTTFTTLLWQEILTSEEYEQLLDKWIAGLQWYYDLHASKQEEPLMLEYSLRRKNIHFDNIPLTGTIDKIEKSVHNSIWNEETEWQMAFFKESITLVDYKTGKNKTIGQVKWLDRYGNKKDDPSEGKYFRQMLFYKLLCELDSELSSQFEVSSLIIDFVEWKDGIYKTIEVEYTPEEFQEFQETIREVWEKINDRDFWKEILKK